MHIGFPEMVVLLVVAILLCGPKSLREVARGLAEGISNFRAGPGSPSHPMPANDSHLLNRKGHSDDKSDDPSRRKDPTLLQSGEASRQAQH
jgi:TatA/E family protein of Tat protein translocase